MNTLPIRLIAAILFTSLLLPELSGARGAELEGTWYYGTTKTTIREKSPGQLTLDNGEGSRATGYLMGVRKISVPRWNVTGKIEDGGSSIVWSNGTEWTRFPDHTTHISGRWYHDGKPTSIEVYDNGWRFTITNEDGRRSDGKARSARELYIPSLNITGIVNKHATKIKWSNGTVWTRNRQGPLSAPE